MERSIHQLVLIDILADAVVLLAGTSNFYQRHPEVVLGIDSGLVLPYENCLVFFCM